MDANGDGKATLDEFKALYGNQFKGLDKNKDGVFTPDEG